MHVEGANNQNEMGSFWSTNTWSYTVATLTTPPYPPTFPLFLSPTPPPAHSTSFQPVALASKGHTQYLLLS